MDAEQQEISSMFDCVALSAGLHQHTLFEWCVCVCVTPSLQTFLQIGALQGSDHFLFSQFRRGKSVLVR